MMCRNLFASDSCCLEFSSLATFFSSLPPDFAPTMICDYTRHSAKQGLSSLVVHACIRLEHYFLVSDAFEGFCAYV